MDSSAGLTDNTSLQKYSLLTHGKTFWDEGQYETILKRIENGKKYA